MIAGLLFRNYKNYENIRFVPIINDINHVFTVFIGNNGVGKSAILEALDAALNSHKTWNTTQGQKKSESFICPLFLIPKTKITASKKRDIELVSNYFWSDAPDKSLNVQRYPGIKDFIDFKNSLKSEYEKTHYLVLIGSSYDAPGGYFSSSFDNPVKKMLSEDISEQQERASQLKSLIWNLYTYLYIPVEESPKELLRLQNSTMQKLLNRDVLQEIEKILKQKQQGSIPIVDQINRNLDKFIKEVNDVISSIDSEYQFAPESGIKQKLTAKDIREKVIEAYFPLRSLKVGTKRIDLLSSGEQRRAIIDMAYSTLIANGDRKTEKYIILAIDEPETSMHISNCFNQFSRLEELSDKGIQILITTHWYGYLPIARNGAMHYLDQQDNQTIISSFNLYNLLELRKTFPDDVELKSMFDLASSLVSFMRRESGYKWIFCEGSDDKLYLQTMLVNYTDLYIIPVGGCGNVIKLYQILYSFMAEKSEEANSDVLFLIDTDLQRVNVEEPFQYNNNKKSITLKRLQIVQNVIHLLNPTKSGPYEQTEMEDCLNPNKYYEALESVISKYGNTDIKRTFKKFELVKEATTSMLRGDNACIRPTDLKYLDKKQDIISFAEDDKHKYEIARTYAVLCKGQSVEHPLADIIAAQLGLKQKGV